MKSINPSLFLLSLVTNFLAIRIAGLFLPDRLYFSFSSFLFDTRDLDKAFALVPKLLLPFCVSFAIVVLLAWLRKVRRMATGGSKHLDNMIRDQTPITLCYGAAMTALLMAWPYILLWDVLIKPELNPYRLTYLLAYFAYIGAIGFFSLAGANAALAWIEDTGDGEPVTLATLGQHKFAKPVVEIVSGAISAGLATFFAAQAG